MNEATALKIIFFLHIYGSKMMQILKRKKKNLSADNFPLTGVTDQDFLFERENKVWSGFFCTKKMLKAEFYIVLYKLCINSDYILGTSLQLDSTWPYKMQEDEVVILKAEQWGFLILICKHINRFND